MNIIEWVLREIMDDRLIRNLYHNLTSSDLETIFRYLDRQPSDIQRRWVDVYNKLL